MGTTQSVLLYGAEVWADALNEEMQVQVLKTQGALRVTSVYCTVYERAVMVMAGMIPAALLAKDRKAIYRRKCENFTDAIACEEHQRTPTEWQLSRQNEPRGIWTARLIDNLDPWLNRTNSEIDYCLAQLLS